MCRRRLLVLGAVALVGCSDSRYPWESSSAAEGPSPPAPPGSAAPAAASGDAPPEGGIRLSGGLFVRCAQGFEPGADPVRDVTRLGLSCGPSTGMARASEVAQEGAVGPEAPEVKLPVELRSGVCYRIFAVASAEIADLMVEVRSARGTVVASDAAVGRVAIVQADRPFCALEDDPDASIVVAAASGRGQFALEIWTVASP